jgi:hypothetical protein
MSLWKQDLVTDAASADSPWHWLHRIAASALQLLYPNHCIGEAALVALTKILGSQVLRPCPAGTVLEL